MKHYRPLSRLERKRQQFRAWVYNHPQDVVSIALMTIIILAEFWILIFKDLV